MPHFSALSRLALVTLAIPFPPPTAVGAQTTGLLVVAHGPSDDEAAHHWTRNIQQAAAPLAREGVPPGVGLLQDDAPPERRARAIAALREQISTLSRAADDSVVVMSVLISSGRINQVTIPADLHGLPIRYVPTALTPSHHIASWILRVALAATPRGEAPNR